MTPTRPAYACLLVAAIAAILLPTPAIAHGETAAVIVYGSAKSQQRDVVASTIQQTLRAASWNVPDHPFSPREHQAIVACVALDRPWPCVAPTARNKGIDHIIVINIEPDKANKGLVLTGQVLIASDTVPSTDRGWCAKCTDALLVTSSAELASLMLQHSAARKPDFDSAAPAVQATKPGETPENKSAPTTAPAASPTAQLAASRSARPVETAGASPVTPAPSTPVDTAPSPSRLVPAIVIGAGVVALGLGTYLSYNADAAAVGAQTQYIYSGPGIALAVAGGAAVGAGIYLWLRSAQHSAPSDQVSAPTLAPASGGAVAGWVTSF